MKVKAELRRSVVLLATVALKRLKNKWIITKPNEKKIAFPS